MFLFLDNQATACSSIEECMNVSNSMTMADRKIYQNIYISSSNNKKAYLKKDGKEIQVNIKQIKEMLWKKHLFICKQIGHRCFFFYRFLSFCWTITFLGKTCSRTSSGSLSNAFAFSCNIAFSLPSAMRSSIVGTSFWTLL